MKAKEKGEKIPFSKKHPKINILIGWMMILAIIVGAIMAIDFVISGFVEATERLVAFLKKFVSTTDKVIIVAMITGMVSIIGVVFTSVIAKIVDYRYNVKKYLNDKREVPYEQFINMVYAIMEDTKKPQNERMSEQDMIKKVSEFSKGLTLWGSNRVVKKWIQYRKASLTKPGTENLWLLEDIIYEIRRDMGQRKKLSKGDALSFFINDMDNIKK